MHTVHKREGRSLYQLAAYTFAAAPPHAVLAMGQPFGAAALVRRGYWPPVGLGCRSRKVLGVSLHPSAISIASALTCLHLPSAGMGPDAPTPFPTGLVATKAPLHLSNPNPSR